MKYTILTLSLFMKLKREEEKYANQENIPEYYLHNR
jgi:hypothetical protein